MTRIIDMGPEPDDYRQHLVDSLSGPDKFIACRFLYDERGSELFDEICRLDAYYPTRTELAIMEKYIREMARLVGPRSRIVELGSGSGFKTRLLLETLDAPTAYLPVDISKFALRRCAERMSLLFPDLDIQPVCADYLRPLELPEAPGDTRRTVAYFPGSTIGNFEPDEAVAFLGRIAEMVGPDGGLLLGVDRVKSPSVLELAYDDPQGVTAEFNLNLLRRANREAGANFDLEAFRHLALYNAEAARIETYLVSCRRQSVRVAGRKIHFDEGERIWTEHSYKYTPERVADLADAAGFTVESMWSDDREWFGVWYLRP